MRTLFRALSNYRTAGVILPHGGGGGGGDPLPPPTFLGTHIGDYIRQPGGQRIVVANGTYDGANVLLAASTHARDTNKPYNGWLVLEAQTPGGVTLDLSDPGPTSGYRGGLPMVYPGVANGFTKLPLRVLLVGLKIINGLNEWAWLDQVRTWYCTFSNEVHQWDTQYRAAFLARHGTNPAQYSTWDENLGMANWTAAAIRGDNVDHLEHYFADFVDCGDDGLFTSLGAGMFLRGCRFDNVWHHNVNYYDAAEGFGLMHSDCIQSTGGTNLTVRNCSFCGHMQFQNNAGSITLDFDNWWVYGSSGLGFSFDESFTTSVIVGTMKHGKWFANGQYGYPNSDYPPSLAPIYGGAGFDRLCYQNDHNRFNAGPAGLHWYDDSGNDVGALAFETANHVFPSGVTQSGAGILSPDYTAYPSAPWPRTTNVFGHASNPAVVDRAAAGHGAADWSTFFDPAATHNPAAGVYGWP